MSKVKEIQAEIEYIKTDGTKIHSDIEPRGCTPDGLKDTAYRDFLHKCLDEWLDNSNGTCGFYIKDAAYEFDSAVDAGSEYDGIEIELRDHT